MKSSPARRSHLIKCLVVIIFAGLYASMMLNQTFVHYAPTEAQAQTKNSPGKSQERFDKLVRGDFFAGMMGDKARLDRGMKFCEEILAKNPKHC